MFNVKVGDVEYHVGFFYDECITECFIHPESSDTYEMNSNIGVGYAVCKYPDVFNKNTGRKLSLKRALGYLDFDRETRKVFWDKYWEKRGKKD